MSAKDLAEKRDILRYQLELRKEYDDFEAWCTEHNPDGWMPFEDWLKLKTRIDAEAIQNSQAVWHEDETA